MSTPPKSGYPNLFKHADRDLGADIEGFDEAHNDALIFVAGHDFFRVARGGSVEMQVFEVWYLSCHADKLVDDEWRERFSGLLPGLQGMSRDDQKRFGLNLLRDFENDPTVQMKYSLARREKS